VQRGQKCAAEGEGCFLLSNAHVLGLLDPGDGHVQARRGDVVSLPSRIDGGPPPNDAQPIGEFWEARRIKFGPADENVIDAAVAKVARPQRVRLSGEIQDIGIPVGVKRSNAVDERDLERLMRDQVVLAKSGRTTGCTRGVIFVLNARLNVPYPPTGRFVEQTVIRELPGRIACPSCANGTPNAGRICEVDANCGRAPPLQGDCTIAADPVGAVVSAKGDSGSLWVTADQRIADPGDRLYHVPVGLLFAGSTAKLCGPGTPNMGAPCLADADCGNVPPGLGDCQPVGSSAFANPIRQVLGTLSISVVGAPRARFIPIVDELGGAGAPGGHGSLSANFQAEPRRGSAPLTVRFTNTSSSSGTITAVQWSFGDGMTSTAFSPEHRYEIPGKYDVTLTVTDDRNVTASKVDRGRITVDP
jgi:hypothetical protein